MESAEIIHRNSYEIKDIMSVMHCSANILIFGFNTASTFELDCFSTLLPRSLLKNQIILNLQEVQKQIVEFMLEYPLCRARCCYDVSSRGYLLTAR